MSLLEKQECKQTKQEGEKKETKPKIAKSTRKKKTQHQRCDSPQQTQKKKKSEEHGHKTLG